VSKDGRPLYTSGLRLELAVFSAFALAIPTLVLLGYAKAATVLFAFFLFLILVAARRLFVSLRLLSKAAERLADGVPDVELEVEGNDEIMTLVETFNRMAHRLREGHDRLRHANDDLRRANLALETLVLTDGLTGLFNHRRFYESLAQEIRRAEADGVELSLLFFDLDRFKEYNDRFGHTAGDDGLRRVAARITRSIRATDTAFRYGGEEFAVLLPGCPSDRAAEVGEKIRAAVAESPAATGGPITVSIGVATYPKDGRTGLAVVNAADAALYAAKAAGRDRVVVWGGEATLPAVVNGR